MPTLEKHEEILALFLGGSASQVARFIESCPDHPARAQAAMMARHDDLLSRAMVLGLLGQALSFGRSGGFGAEVAIAAYHLMTEAYARLGPATIFPFTVSRTAYEAIHALNVAGEYRRAIALVEEVLPDWGEEPQNGASIRVARMSAMLALGQLGPLEPLVKAEVARGPSGPSWIELMRIKEKLDALLRRPTELARARTPVVPNADLAASSVRERDALDAFGRMLTGGGTEINEWHVMKMIRDATAIFADPEAGRDRTRIQPALRLLHQARDWAEANGSHELENDALWGIYLSHSRLEQPAEGANALQALRDNIEAARATVTDPMRRAAIGATYPFLYPALCRMLVLANRPLDLLEAMEGAKGRAVADLMVRHSSRPMDERSIAGAARRLPELMRRHDAHYLSFFVDDEETYAALVARDGSVHASTIGSIPIGNVSLAEIARHVDPSGWGKSADDPLFGAVVEPVTARLAPMVAWLGALVDSGVIAEGEHLCYAPDERLHHIPLHYLQLGDRPLGEILSLSRTHGAAALELSLESNAAGYDSCLAVVVPTRGEAGKKAFVDNLRRGGLALERFVDVDSLEGADATVTALASRPLTHRVVHFATHGLFPLPGSPRGENPFVSSGLLLATADGLPDENIVGHGGASDALLTPERVLDLDLDFRGSHVTLQACVSGLAEEGIGGDALGLEWALMQAGAGSLLVSHWNVSAALAAAFVERFYQRWLGDRGTRAAAWRGTIAELRAEKGRLSDPYCWAAFSLTGDWR